MIVQAVDVTYDTIGRSYTATRREDPRIAAAIHRALGDACSVLNVGAGAGSYEPSDRVVVAVEPSEVMMPFPDGSYDATMAILSDHHWEDRPAGLRELARVARCRVVLFNADPAEAGRFWMTREYLPEFADLIPAGTEAPGNGRRS